MNRRSSTTMHDTKVRHKGVVYTVNYEVRVAGTTKPCDFCHAESGVQENTIVVGKIWDEDGVDVVDADLVTSLTAVAKKKLHHDTTWCKKTECALKDIERTQS